MNMVVYSSFAPMVVLWGWPYLAHIYGYDLEARGNFLLVPVLAQIVGSMAWGSADRLFGSYKLPVLLGSGLTATALAWLAVVGTLSPVGLVVWFAAFGLIGAIFFWVIIGLAILLTIAVWLSPRYRLPWVGNLIEALFARWL